MDMNIVIEAENLLIIRDLLEDDTVEYIEKLIDSYRNNYSTDEIYENLYFREFHETIEIAKQQLKEKGIDYNTAITERVDEMLFSF